MFPYIVHFGPITIATFPIFLIIAMFAGLFVIWKRGKELHYDEKELFDVVFTAGFWLIIGSRLGHVILHLSDLHPDNILPTLTRLSWFLPTGLIAAYVALTRVVKKLRWDVFQVADILVTGFILSQAFVALGSFVAGIGYGMATDSIIGIHFANLYDKRYPIQIWEFLGFSMGFVYLWWVEGVYRTFPWYRGNKSQAATGFITAMYLIWWGIVSSVAVLFRTPSLTYAGFRFDIFVPILFGIIGGAILLWYRAAGSWHGIRYSILDYFGLTKKSSASKRKIDLPKLFE